MDGPNPRQRPTLELRDYLKVIRRRWVLIAAFTTVFLLASFAITQIRTPTYEATAGILLDGGHSRTILHSTSDILPNLDDQATTEADLMRTNTVRAAIAEIIGYEPDVSIQVFRANKANEETRLISIVASGAGADEVVRKADEFAAAYIEVRKELIDVDLRENIEANDLQLTTLDEQSAAARKRILEIEAALPGEADPDRRLILQAEMERLEYSLQSGAIAQRQAEINARSDLLQTALVNNSSRGIFRRSPAERPSAPISPRPVRDSLVGGLIGLVIGLFAAFLRDYYDDTLRTKEDVDGVSGGEPVIGLIPIIESWKHGEEAVLEAHQHPRSAASESYRSLRTSLEFAALDHKMKVIQVTSSNSGEGKTTTAANLAVTMALAGKRVVLIDCDLRRPRLHDFFDLVPDVGFTSILIGEVEVGDALQRIDGLPNLVVLPSGVIPPNPSELLATRAAQMLIESSASAADHVILDGPPLLPVTDSLILAGMADSVLLVARARTTARREFARSLELLDQVSAPVEGIVLNGVGAEGSYGYGYGYGSDDSSGLRRAASRT